MNRYFITAVVVLASSQFLTANAQDKPKPADTGFINPIHTELHSHLIPAIDDGVQTMEESIEILRVWSEMGYKKVITTPHIMGDFYKNGPENILGFRRQTGGSSA